MELWIHARMDLGLRREEFDRMQPRQVFMMSRHWQQRREEAEFLFAQVAASVVNFSQRAPKEMIQPREFMPSWLRKQHAEAGAKRLVKRTKVAIATEVRGVMALFMR